MNKLEKKLKLKISLKEAWDFFSNPRNLPKITPPELNFKISPDTPDKVYQGIILHYTVSPIAKIPLNWTTEITHLVENKLFVDEQRFGPYKFWHHQHLFEEDGNEVLMTDIIHYKIPFEFLVPFMNNLYVGKKLKDIFDFREKTLTKLFNS